MASTDVSAGSPSRGPRRRKQNVPFPQPTGPQARSQLIPREVPNVAAGGLAGLDKAFSSFFGSIANVGKAVTKLAEEDAKERIDRENKEQKLSAFVKAHTGEAPTEDELKDRDFADASAKAKGGIFGSNLADDFRDELAKQPLSVDARAFAQEFLARELKNGNALGTGVPEFDRAAVTTFMARAETLIRQRGIATTKAAIADAQNSFISSVAARFDELEPSDFGSLLRDARAVNPVRPWDGPGLVISALVAAAGNNPKRLQKLSTLLIAEGTGDDGKSFAETFHKAYREIETKLGQEYITTRSLAGKKAYADIRDALLQEKDPARIAALALEADKVFSVHGGRNDLARIKTQVARRLEAIQKETVAINRIGAMIGGIIPVSKKEVSKNLAAFLRSRDIDLLNDPEQVASIVTKLQLNDHADVRSFYSSALLNPDRASAAFRYFQQIERLQGKDAALALMNSSVQFTYLQLRRRVTIGREDVPTAVEALREKQDLVREANKASLKPLVTGASSEARAVAKVRDRVLRELKSKFGERVQVREDLMQELIDGVKFMHLSRNKDGDFDETIEDYIATQTAGLHMVPGEDDSIIIKRTLIPNAVDGEATIRMKEQINPATGEAENPMETFRDDTKLFVAGLGGSTINGRKIGTDGLSLNPNSQFAAKGLYGVEHRGEAVVFRMGSKITIGGKEVFLPNDVGGAREVLENLRITVDQAPPTAPEDVFLKGRKVSKPSPGFLETPASDRFVLVPFPVDAPRGFMLLYRPGFRFTLNPKALPERTLPDAAPF